MRQSTVRSQLFLAVETARKSEVFHNYLEVRERVFEMLEQEQNEYGKPSLYWKEELARIEYMFDASPLIVSELREHCYHLTAVRPYDYRQHHSRWGMAFGRKLRLLRQQDEFGLLVPESPLLGGFGYEIDGGLFNLDTLKYYECLIALSKAGLLTSFRLGCGTRKIISEIGAGWGGFAYQFKTLCRNVTYIIIDFPQVLLFSAVYLKTLFPSAAVLFWGDKSEETLLRDCEAYDFVFLPNYFMDKAKLERLDLALNMISFQEMTSAQVDHYVRRIAELGSPYFYSFNAERSPHNDQLTTVSSIMGKYYWLTELKVLDIPYTAMPKSGFRATARKFETVVRRLLRGAKRKSYTIIAICLELENRRHKDGCYQLLWWVYVRAETGPISDPSGHRRSPRTARS